MFLVDYAIFPIVIVEGDKGERGREWKAELLQDGHVPGGLRHLSDCHC